MNTDRRFQVALTVNLIAIIAVTLLVAAHAARPGARSTYTPAGNGIHQPAGPIGAGLDLNFEANTVDPPAAHDSDMPIGTSSVSATTTVRPATSSTPPPAPQATTTLTTITENGTVIVPKPETEDPPRPTAVTVPCGDPTYPCAP